MILWNRNIFLHNRKDKRRIRRIMVPTRRGTEITEVRAIKHRKKTHWGAIVSERSIRGKITIYNRRKRHKNQKKKT